METALIEIEAGINSRPLTYLYDDDVTDPSTPSHLLRGRNMFLKCDENTTSTVVPPDIGKRARCVQRTLHLFWSKFKRCYLAVLREHHMYQNKRNKSSDDNLLNVNDVILVKDDILTPRSSWRMARVDSLAVGRDGNVRVGVLSAVSKNGKRSKLARPLQTLIPLEVNSRTRRVLMRILILLMIQMFQILEIVHSIVLMNQKRINVLQILKKVRLNVETMRCNQLPLTELAELQLK